MFDLIPWKKRKSGDSIPVRCPEPTYEQPGYHSLNRFRSPFGSLVDQFFGDSWFGQTMGSPALWGQWGANWDSGWEDRENEYAFRAELPGFEPGDFDIKLSDNRVTISAEHKEEENREKGKQAYRYGSFRRSFTLPQGVDDSKIRADYRSGVLEIHLPKTHESQGKRIPIKFA